MHFSTSALVLVAFAAGQAVAATMGVSGHNHGKMHNNAARHAELMKAYKYVE